MTSIVQDGATARPFAYAAFRLFWGGRVLSSLAFQMSAVSIGWLIYDQTSSASNLGLVGLFQFLPMVCLTFPVGHIADRFDRKKIVSIAQAVEGLTLLILALGAVSGWLHPAAIFAAVVV